MKRTTKDSQQWVVGGVIGIILVAGLVACTRGAGQAESPDLAAFDAGELQFPKETWVVVDQPPRWGWSGEHLAEAHAYFETLDTSALMVVHRGVLIADWGDSADRQPSQSIRKALLGALLGQEVAAGRLRLDATLAELGIDDSSQPLTPLERSARVIELLQSTSGVYLSAIYEAGMWKRAKPERGTHAPGETWYYNNWGFNALGTIFELTAGLSVHEAFSRRVAEPIGMEDYREKDVQYLARKDLSERMMGNDSAHPAYHFMISARDLARFGLLYLAGGRWEGIEVVPAEWVEQSTIDTVFTHERFDGDRYGFLWWTSPPESALGQVLGVGSYKATGGRGHKVLVVPDLDLVVVHRLATGGVGLLSQVRRRVLGAPSVNDQQFNELMRLVVAAHPER